MVRVYDPIKEQAEAAKQAAEIANRQAESSERALILAQRAWIGPTNASIRSDITVGKALEGEVLYQNSGRAPGVDFVSYVEMFTTKIMNDPNILSSIQGFVSVCRDATGWEGGSVVFPANSAVGYNLSIRSQDSFVTEALAKGEEIAVIMGCFSYRTFEQPKHTAFCYFYKQGMSKTSNLSICQTGSEAN